MKAGKITSEGLMRVHRDRAVHKLYWMLCKNFRNGDLHIILTYGEKEPTVKEAKTNLEKFNRLARAYFRERGQEFRYIAVTEYKSSRLHHHIVMPGLPAEVLQMLWSHGNPRITAIYEDGQCRALAEYLIRETDQTFRDEDSPGRKRWSASNNLK